MYLQWCKVVVISPLPCNCACKTLLNRSIGNKEYVELCLQCCHTCNVGVTTKILKQQAYKKPRTPENHICVVLMQPVCVFFCYLLCRQSVGNANICLGHLANTLTTRGRVDPALTHLLYWSKRVRGQPFFVFNMFLLLLLLRWRHRSEGTRLKAMAGFEHSRGP